jgi:hypothetical protein
MTRKFAWLLGATLIPATIGMVAPSYAQVRVITGDTEHIYGYGGQVLDDDALRARNEHAERIRQLERARRDAMRRQEELDAAAARAAAAGYEEQQVGSSYIGAFGIRHRRHAILQRYSTVGTVSGNSLHGHSNARGRR